MIRRGPRGGTLLRFSPDLAPWIADDDPPAIREWLLGRALLRWVEARAADAAAVAAVDLSGASPSARMAWTLMVAEDRAVLDEGAALLAGFGLPTPAPPSTAPSPGALAVCDALAAKCAYRSRLWEDDRVDDAVRAWASRCDVPWHRQLVSSYFHHRWARVDRDERRALADAMPGRWLATAAAADAATADDLLAAGLGAARLDAAGAALAAGRLLAAGGVLLALGPALDDPDLRAAFAAAGLLEPPPPG